jgi:hypothetical protein
LIKDEATGVARRWDPVGNLPTQSQRVYPPLGEPCEVLCGPEVAFSSQPSPCRWGDYYLAPFTLLAEDNLVGNLQVIYNEMKEDG